MKTSTTKPRMPRISQKLSILIQNSDGMTLYRRCGICRERMNGILMRGRASWADLGKLAKHFKADIQDLIYRKRSRRAEKLLPSCDGSNRDEQFSFHVRRGRTLHVNWSEFQFFDGMKMATVSAGSIVLPAGQCFVELNRDGSVIINQIGFRPFCLPLFYIDNVAAAYDLLHAEPNDTPRLNLPEYQRRDVLNEMRRAIGFPLNARCSNNDLNSRSTCAEPQIPTDEREVSCHPRGRDSGGVRAIAMRRPESFSKARKGDCHG